LTLSALSDSLDGVRTFERRNVVFDLESDPVKRIPIWMLLLTVLGACTSRAPVNPSQFQLAPALTVERFLQAANSRDLETMSRLFGTDDGPIADSGNREEIELRMDVIAEILQHRDYEIMSERSVPGAEAPSNRIGVDISLPGGVRVGDVGFTVVLESANRWLISVIELTKITEGG
jgi:hypothetical protein